MAPGTALACAQQHLIAGTKFPVALDRSNACRQHLQSKGLSSLTAVTLRASGLLSLVKCRGGAKLIAHRSARRFSQNVFLSKRTERGLVQAASGDGEAEGEWRHRLPVAEEASVSGRTLEDESRDRLQEAGRGLSAQALKGLRVESAELIISQSSSPTLARWAGAILLGVALMVVNTQPALAAWGSKGKREGQTAPRPASVALTDEQRRVREQEAAARRAEEDAKAEVSRREEEQQRRAQAAKQVEQEKQRQREQIVHDVQFFREQNPVTREWQLPLSVFEECADAGLVDVTLLGWSNDSLRVQLKAELGAEAQEEYLVLVPYTDKKRIVQKYTGDMAVAAGIGLGADYPRNLFEELNYESTTGEGRGQNLARKKIDLTFKNLGKWGPLMFLGERINPEELGFHDGEAMYVWLEFWLTAALAAGWGWVTYADKDQKSERHWDKKARAEFSRQFQGADMHVDVSLKDVAGLDHVVDELQEVITFLQFPDKFEAMGARPPRGMLLYGTPGTGKTLLARAIAGEAKVPILHVVASKFAMGATTVGVQAARLRGMFAYAKQRAPCVIFLDEIDGLCKKRVGSNSDKFQEQERAVTLNQLLVEMDGFNTYANKGVLLIGATNNPEDLDPAMTRPGRMDRIIEMPLPDLQGRVDIMTLYNRGWTFKGPIDLHEISRRAEGLTPADLSDVFEDAISDKLDNNIQRHSFRQWHDVYFRKRGPYYFLHPVAWLPAPVQEHFPRWLARVFTRFFEMNPEDILEEEDYCLTQDDLRKAIDFIALEKESIRGQRSPNFWAPTIWHTRTYKLPFAVGLITTGWIVCMLPNHPPVTSCWLEKYEGETQAVFNGSAWPSTLFSETATRRMLEKMLVVLVSGYVGFKLLLPEHMQDTLLHAADLKQAQRLAREMCATTGYSFDDDATVWAGAVQGEANSSRHIKKTKSPAMGWAKQQELREMGDVLVNIAINKAAEILIPQKEIMDELVERLLVHDRLEREDFEAHMRKHNVQPVDEFWLTPGGRFSIPEPEGLHPTMGGIQLEAMGTPVDLGPKRLTLTELGTKYARKYKQIIKRPGFVPADRWNDPSLEGKAWQSAPPEAVENVLEVAVEKAAVRR